MGPFAIFFIRYVTAKGRTGPQLNALAIIGC
jgi:hypothetical protein